VDHVAGFPKQLLLLLFMSLLMAMPAAECI
jgi:hypothetical protein